MEQLVSTITGYISGSISLVLFFAVIFYHAHAALSRSACLSKCMLRKRQLDESGEDDNYLMSTEPEVGGNHRPTFSVLQLGLQCGGKKSIKADKKHRTLQNHPNLTDENIDGRMSNSESADSMTPLLI